ncbi:hypothetical protein MZK49_26535 [Ensifer sesbaniae]|uniref:hypothetical protein n=1 Tax=Ensifer sesbaniae TaxID=1214071 RepID=UPI002000FD07|nr:hypothetical protein [Ensifer sesbaniae]
MEPIVDTVIAIETSDDLPSIQQAVRNAWKKIGSAGTCEPVGSCKQPQVNPGTVC